MTDSTYDYINFLDAEDSLMKQMHSIIDTSPTLGSILQKKNFFTIGKGFVAVPVKTTLLSNFPTETKVTQAQTKEIEPLLKRANESKERLISVVSDVISDFYDFGNGYLEIIKKTGGASFYHKSFHEVRLKEVRNRKKDTHYCVISRDFDGFSSFNYERKTLPLYPNFELIDGFERCILHIKKKKKGFDYYGMPTWIKAKLWAEIEYRIPKYAQSEFDNGFMPSALVQLFGAANDTQIQDALDVIAGEQTGTANHSKLIGLHVLPDTTPAKVDLLTQKRDGSYLELGKTAREQIMLSENFSDALLGIKTAGALGGSQQLRAELEIKYEEIFVPMQNYFTENLLQPILDIYAEQQNRPSEISLGFVKNIPVNFFGDMDLTSVLTEDEKREIAKKQGLIS